MKGNILITVLLSTVIGVGSSFSQTSPEIGFKAGLSIPNLTSGSSDNPISNGYSSRLDVDAAVHIEFHINGWFSIQPQFEYSSQGGKKDGTQAFTVPVEMMPLFPPGQAPPYLYATYKSEARMNYLLLPILAKFHPLLDKKWGAYVAIGPFVSYLLSAKNITKGSSMVYLDKEETQALVSSPQSFNSKDNIRNDLHHFNAGISGHLGVDCRIGNGKVFFEAGGNYGLIDIQKTEVNGKNKTGAAAINVGYQFQF